MRLNRYADNGLTIETYDRTLVEYDIEGNQRSVIDDKRRVALVETETIGRNANPNLLAVTTARYQFDNHLGSAVLELDERARIISYEEYFPYGSTSYQAVRGIIANRRQAFDASALGRSRPNPGSSVPD